MMYKVHKKTLGTRPVVSDCASITNPIGKWVDTMLQPMARSMPTWFRDSFELKSMLDNFVVPQGARVFTSDAVGMYPNISTPLAMARIAPYLRDPATQAKFDHYNPEALIRALEIVMYNSIIKFGDIYRRQTSGTMMGTPCAPPWATIFQGLDEQDRIIPAFTICLPLFVRYLDDIFGVWVPDPNLDAEIQWTAFKSLVNSSCLEWEFSELTHSVNFLDLTITITGDEFTTTLYEKPMALYLYIPPHSAHPPGITPGHVNGEVLRIHRLCSDEDDIIERCRVFFRRQLDRGHKAETLIPLFRKAVTNAHKFLAKSQEQCDREKLAKLEASRRRVYFHVTFHPQGPKARDIQHLFDIHVLNPPDETPFNELGGGTPLDAMIVANHRAPNLGNMLSYRKIENRIGPPVSSFIE